MPIDNIKSMLIQFFSELRPVSRFSIERRVNADIIDSAIHNGYIIQVGNSSVGESPLYQITTAGRKFRDE